MARKELGHVELHWRCSNCDHLNLGRERSCSTCGAPQPEDVQFEQVTQQELIEDEALIAQAEAGADIHCAYCGTRNAADAKTCVQCGADISEGTQRQTGRVLGAYQSGAAAEAQPLVCPACGAENDASAVNCAQCGAPLAAPPATAQPAAAQPETATKSGAAAPQKSRKTPLALIVGAVLVCIGLVVAAILLLRTTSLTGSVQQVQWERSIAIEAYGPVTYSDWQDELPAAAEDIACEQKFRYVSDTPEENAEEVCGTPYTVDSGSGFADVVQDCEYHVYDAFCSYTVVEWSQADTVVASGAGFAAEWPDPVLESDQRLGDARSESYQVIFATDDGNYTYTTEDFAEFQQYQPGSVWTLAVNALGGVTSVQP